VSDSDLPPLVLEVCSGCQEELDVTTFEPFAEVICPMCGVETRVKRQLGKYFLERRYATGGMSVVYLATDETLNREVAIKVLNEQCSVDEVRVAAFEQEAQLTAAVNHSNVVQVYTVGRAYGRFYLVMELLRGHSFEALMAERGALPEDEVLEIALQVTRGLRAANDSSVLHRDVKPGNILLNENGQAKLVDFGLALITQAGSTKAEEIWATPYYVPPEALEKGIEDFRSDLYAFGATLYHGLTGKPPFESTSNGMKVLRRAKQTIPRLGKVAPWLTDATCDAIDGMMAYQPKHRWGSYDEVLEVLQRARSGATSACGLKFDGGRAMRRSKENRWVLPAAVGLALVGVGVASFVWKPWENRGEKEDRQVIEPTPIEMVPVEQSFDANRNLTESWSFARGLVGKDEFKRAETKLLELGEDEVLREPTSSFARIEAGIIACLDGRAGEARERAGEIYGHLKNLGKKNQATETLEELALALSKTRPPSESDFPENPKGIIDWMGVTALALKLWEQGLIVEAIPWLEKVRDSSINRDFEWYSVYQKQAEKYLKDAALITKADAMPLPTSEEEARYQLDNLNERMSLLETKGRMHFNIRAKQIYLTRLRKGFELRPESSSKNTWAERLEKIRERAGERRFDLAAELIDPKDIESKPATVVAWKYLLEQGQGFFNEFAMLPEWEVESTRGEVVKCVSANQEGVKLASGAQLEWTELKTSSLLTVHKELRDSKENVTARLEMREQEISFAWLAGFEDQAEQEAEELAGASEDFRKIWRQVLVGISQ
jgi:predicted Ser/Thr protein kinase